MAKIGDILNKLACKEEVKHCFLPQNLINARIVREVGELTIGVSKDIAVQFATQALSNEPNELAGMLILFDREKFNQAFKEAQDDIR